MRRRILWVGVLAAALATALFAGPLAVAVSRLYLADQRGELERVKALINAGTCAMTEYLEAKK